jgi:hypothetical protein
MDDEELEYKCQTCEEWFGESYLYCPNCGAYSTCSGMTETRVKDD